ncbi:hypothetical protein ABPG75_005330 [Micractinium tetrahymenae]
MAAVAHVVAEDSGVCFVPQPGQQLFYDEAAGCIHLIEGRMITAVALPPAHPAAAAGRGGGSAGALAAGAAAAGRHRSSPSRDLSGYDSDSSIASSTARAFLVSEGPPVRHIRSSLDGAFTALHRSARLVEVHCHATGNMFVEAAGADKAGRRGGDPQLLGFFWTAAHFVMVTAAGLEVHSVLPSLQGLRLESSVALQGVQWYTYSPETHMVVMGFGSSGAKLQAIQFSKAGTLKLPLLDLTPPWGSPIRPAVAAAVSAALDGFSATREQPARLVGPDTCWVAVLYGRVFCCHHDRAAGLLRLYRLFRDATSLAHTYEVYARQLELSVVDNVLLVHHIDSAVVMLVDIMAPGAAPISSPLPLAVPLGDHGHGEAAHGPVAARGSSPAPNAGPPGAAAVLLPPPGTSALQLHYPCWLVDGGAGLVFRLQLDLRAVADSLSEHTRLLAFLQRRQPSTVPARDAAGITLRVLRGLMREEAPLPELRAAFDVVNGFAAEAAAAADAPGSGHGSSSSASGSRAATPPPGGAVARQPLPPPPVVTPQDAYNSGFALLRSQGACRAAHLQAALAEYVASCCLHGAQVAPSLAALYVELLLDQGLPHLVAPLLLSHPQLDSVLLAEHVEEAESGGRLPGGTRLAEQLLERLGAAEPRCRLLLRAGRVRQALLLARRERLIGQLASAALLEAAAGCGDALLEAAARRVVGAAAGGGAALAAA